MCTINHCNFCTNILSISETILLEYNDYLKIIILYSDKILLNLGNHYKYTTNNYELMKKYYLMAIQKGSLSAMFFLGYYYIAYENNYRLMKKYYLLYYKYTNDNTIYNPIDQLLYYYKLHKYTDL